MSLTNKQQVFIREYTRDFNASRAARAAGYSEKTAYSSGQRLLKDVEVEAAIRAHIAEVSMSEDEVKTRLADIARGDMADLMALSTGGFTFELMIEDEEGNRIVNPKTKLIKRIKQRVTTILAKNNTGEDREIIDTELELYSAHDALRDIGKMYAMFTDRTEMRVEGEVVVKTVKGVSLDDL